MINGVEALGPGQGRIANIQEKILHGGFAAISSIYKDPIHQKEWDSSAFDRYLQYQDTANG